MHTYFKYISKTNESQSFHDFKGYVRATLFLILCNVPEIYNK